MKKPRLKKPAVTYPAPQTTEECAAMINTIGILQRDIIRYETEMNDEIACITNNYKGKFVLLKKQLEGLQNGVQLFCESKRAELTQNGKTKTANFVTGSVQWRQRPLSVSVRGVDTVINSLKERGLHRFLRIKEEINKDAIKNELDVVKDIAGIAIISGQEDFVIEPFEQEV